jgi:hypothetical protein
MNLGAADGGAGQIPGVKVVYDRRPHRDEVARADLWGGLARRGFPRACGGPLQCTE